MKGKDIKWCPSHGYPLPCCKCGSELSPTQQKEIFEAGKEQGLKDQSTPRTDREHKLVDKEFAKLYRKSRVKSKREINLCFEAYANGIKEVVEFINDNRISGMFVSDGKWCFRCQFVDAIFQAKLKEWEVKDEIDKC